MRFHDIYEDVLGSREKIRLLTLFLNFPTKAFSANEAAGLTEMSGTGAWRIAKEFGRQGLLSRKRIGHADAWQLNKKHFLVKKMRVLTANPWKELTNAIQNKLAGTGLAKIVLFGSMARKKERPDSDIDVLILVKTTQDKEKANRLLLDLTLESLYTFGNRLSPVIYTEEEYGQKTKSGLSLSSEIKKEGRVLFESR